MSEPKVLMLDEPAAGLNPQETQELARFLHTVADEGVTLLLVEHDMSFVHALAKSVVVLNFGAKIFDGPVSAVGRDKAVLEAYLGTRSRTAGRAVGRAVGETAGEGADVA